MSAASPKEDPPLSRRKTTRVYVIPPPPRDVLVGPILYFVIFIGVLALTAVSLGVPWYRKDQYKSTAFGGDDYESTITLWRTTEKYSAQLIHTSVGDYCWPVTRRTKVMEAFSVVSVFFAAVSVVLGFFNMMAHGANVVFRRLCCASAIFTFGATTISVSFALSVYYTSFNPCGEGSSYHSQLYEVYYGFGFMCTAMALCFVGGITVPHNVTIPLDARSIDLGINTFTLLAFIATLFVCTSCPITHWTYKDQVTQRATDVQLWRTQEGWFQWNRANTTEKDSFWVANYNCGTVKTMFRATGVVSIVATAFSFFAMSWGILLWMYLTPYVLPALILAALGFLLTLTQFILETLIFYNTWCTDYRYYKEKYVRGPGYALCASSFCIMFVAILYLVAGYISLLKYFPSKINRSPEAISTKEQ